MELPGNNALRKWFYLFFTSVLSLANGQLEAMLHRRILSTDDEGPLDLDDTDRLENIQFFLLFDSTQEVSNTMLCFRLADTETTI